VKYFLNHNGLLNIKLSGLNGMDSLGKKISTIDIRLRA
jgi:hypothetical protein